MRIKHLDLVVAIVIALCNLLWSTLSHHRPLTIGILLALPQVFLLPGYTLIELLFYHHPLENVRRFVMSLCLSISICILSGFLLNYLPGGMTGVPWAIDLSGLTIIFSLAAMFRRTGHRITVVRKVTLVKFYANLRKHKISLLFMSLVIGLTALSIAYSSYSVNHAKRLPFTQLWLLPATASTHTCAVMVGVDNFEFNTTKYHIFITTTGALTSTWSSPVLLAPQKSWYITRPLDIGHVGDITVEARLYEDKHPSTLYRSVHIVLHVKKTTTTQGWSCSL